MLAIESLLPPCTRLRHLSLTSALHVALPTSVTQLQHRSLIIALPPFAVPLRPCLLIVALPTFVAPLQPPPHPTSNAHPPCAAIWRPRKCRQHQPEVPPCVSVPLGNQFLTKFVQLRSPPPYACVDAILPRRL